MSQRFVGLVAAIAVASRASVAFCAEASAAGLQVQHEVAPARWQDHDIACLLDALVWRVFACPKRLHPIAASPHVWVSAERANQRVVRPPRCHENTMAECANSISRGGTHLVVVFKELDGWFRGPDRLVRWKEEPTLLACEADQRCV